MGNKNSGRRDNLPRGMTGRPRTRIIVHLPRPHMVALEKLALLNAVDLEELAQQALVDYVLSERARYWRATGERLAERA